jgi:hypothetical protein
VKKIYAYYIQNKMGNAWLDFLAEERDKDENKDVPPMELSSHVRPKYDAWKAENGIESKVEEDKMEEVEVVKKRRRKSTKRKGKKGKKSRKTRKH